MHIGLELTKIPALFDDDGARIIVWVQNATQSRKTAVAISKQGISYYGMETYSDLDDQARYYFAEGQTLTLKLTGLDDTDDHHAYLATAGTSIYKKGFQSYYLPGSASKVGIEVVGTALNSPSINVLSIQIRTHDYDPQTDPISINNTKPLAEIT